MEGDTAAANYGETPRTEPVLRWYWREKRKFYTTHTYTGGDNVPIPPVTILAKKDAGGNIVECHVGPAVLSQGPCMVLLAFLNKTYTVPLLKGVVKRTPAPETGGARPRVHEVTVPSGFEEAILLLEDIPWPPSQGVLINLYPPPSIEEAGAAKILATTMTMMTVIPDARRIPVVPVAVGNAVSRAWREALDSYTRTIMAGGGPSEAGFLIEKAIGKAAEAIVESISKLQGQTLTFFLDSKSPPLGVLPVFV